jgi:hypothetical protein
MSRETIICNTKATRLNGLYEGIGKYNKIAVAGQGNGKQYYIDYLYNTTALRDFTTITTINDIDSYPKVIMEVDNLSDLDKVKFDLLLIFEGIYDASIDEYII